jgi:3-hydroxyisobutyrate dehydrogenase-like beta-hydroxyacid dehydrogenase
MAEKIGFVGLGLMGAPMAERLLKAGYQLFVYDRTTQS